MECEIIEKLRMLLKCYFELLKDWVIIYWDEDECERNKFKGENLKFGFEYVRVDFVFSYIMEMLKR